MCYPIGYIYFTDHTTTIGSHVDGSGRGDDAMMAQGDNITIFGVCSL